MDPLHVLRFSVLGVPAKFSIALAPVADIVTRDILPTRDRDMLYRNIVSRGQIVKPKNRTIATIILSLSSYKCEDKRSKQVSI